MWYVCGRREIAGRILVRKLKGKRIRLEGSNEVVVTRVTCEVVKLISLALYDKRREIWGCIKVPGIYQLAEELSAF